MFPIETRLTTLARVHDTVVLRTIIGFTALAAVMPVHALAQIRIAVAPGPPPPAAINLAVMCAARLRDDDSFVARVAAVLALPDKQLVEQALTAMEPEARQAVNDSPGDPGALYNLAIVIGARADMTKGRSRIPLASEVHVLAAKILEADPEHAGAHYVLGRLHAAVMRLGRIQRFLSINLLGGGALSGASWERAQQHLEVAESGDPCIPDHHFELAQLYLERHQADAARAELEHVLQLTEIADERWIRVRARAIDLQEGIERN